MTDPDATPHSERACAQLLSRFLRTPSELIDALAPEGWERSPFRLVFHPTAAQRHAEWESVQRNIESLLGNARAASTELSQEEESGLSMARIQPEREVIELFGYVLWDVFSNNHRVVDQNGTEFDLGSFRASAGFIADEINERYPELRETYDYLDFYMGTIGLDRRADLRPAYRWVFRELFSADYDWKHSFPRLYLISLDEPAELTDPLQYDPSESVRRELENAERRDEVSKFAHELDQLYDEAVDQARHAPPPAIVSAYRDIFGRYPAGWPPRRSDE